MGLAKQLARNWQHGKAQVIGQKGVESLSQGVHGMMANGACLDGDQGWRMVNEEWP